MLTFCCTINSRFYIHASDLQGMPGVVTLNFELEAMKNLNKWLEQQVISDILAVSELPNANSKGTLAAMLVLYKKTYGRRLCVVLEVNDRIDSAQLISLLTSIKYLGHDLDNGVSLCASFRRLELPSGQ